LPAIEFAINSARSEVMRYAPFFLNHGRMPWSFIWDDPSKEEYPSVRAYAMKIKNALLVAHDSIPEAQVKQTRNTNRKRQIAPFSEGDLAYISSKNIQFLKGLARKFLSKYIGPYKILKDFGNNSYRMDLPDRMSQRGIHNVFHASKLRIHVPNNDHLFPGRVDTQVRDFDDKELQREYVIERILDHVGSGCEVCFKIKWKDGDIIWLPYHKISHLNTVMEYLEAIGINSVLGLHDKGEWVVEADEQVELGNISIGTIRNFQLEKNSVPRKIFVWTLPFLPPWSTHLLEVSTSITFNII
jgi:hypothetical protein